MAIGVGVGVGGIVGGGCGGREGGGKEAALAVGVRTITSLRPGPMRASRDGVRRAESVRTRAGAGRGRDRGGGGRDGRGEGRGRGARGERAGGCRVGRSWGVSVREGKVRRGDGERQGRGTGVGEGGRESRAELVGVCVGNMGEVELQGGCEGGGATSLTNRHGRNGTVSGVGVIDIIFV